MQALNICTVTRKTTRSSNVPKFPGFSAQYNCLFVCSHNSLLQMIHHQLHHPHCQRKWKHVVSRSLLLISYYTVLLKSLQRARKRSLNQKLKRKMIRQRRRRFGNCCKSIVAMPCPLWQTKQSTEESPTKEQQPSPQQRSKEEHQSSPKSSPKIPPPKPPPLGQYCMHTIRYHIFVVHRRRIRSII